MFSCAYSLQWQLRISLYLKRHRNTTNHLNDLWRSLYWRTKRFRAQEWSSNAWLSVKRMNIAVPCKEHYNSWRIRGDLLGAYSWPVYSCPRRNGEKLNIVRLCVCVGGGMFCIQVSLCWEKDSMQHYTSTRLLKEAGACWTLNCNFRSHTLGVYGGKWLVSTGKNC